MPKANFTFLAVTVQIEGSEEFVSDQASKLVSSQRGTESAAETLLLEKGIDHAWEWFSLHANQRMQGVNFFLVAVAFLSTAYVSAVHFHLAAVAAGVGLLAVVFALCFLLFEFRVRELIKAAEAALYPAQSRLAELTGVPEVKICEIVEESQFEPSKYSHVIRTLYGTTAIGFFFGFLYQLRAAFATQSAPIPALMQRISSIFAATLVLWLCQRMLARDRATLSWLHYVIAFAFLLLGGFVLVFSVIRPLS